MGAVDVAVEGHHERHRVLGNRVGRVGGHPDDVDAGASAAFEIDVVEAGAAERHEPHAQLAQPLGDAGVHDVVDERADDPEPLGEADRVRSQARLEETEGEAVAVAF